MNRHPLSLAQLTALPFDPPKLVQLAADVGCDTAGIRLLPAAPGGAHYPLMDDARMLRETLAVIAATGVPVLDLELIRIDQRFDARAFVGFFEVGQRLGAKHILVAGDDADTARLTANFAALCDATAPFGLSCDLEPMPWTCVPDLATAMRVVGDAQRPNGGLLVDAIHFYRAPNTLAQVESLPRGWLHYAQICDATVPPPATRDGLIHDARCHRLLPGEGGLDLAALFSRLPAELPISIEIPDDERAPALGYAEWARQALAATREVLERLQLAGHGIGA